MALGVCLVPAGPTRFTSRNASRSERKSGAHDTTGLGTNVPFLLDVLDCAHCRDGDLFVALRTTAVEYLASSAD